jgi:phosphatidate phosphatase APP1
MRHGSLVAIAWLGLRGAIAASPIVVVSDIDDTIKNTHVRLMGTPLLNPLVVFEAVHHSRPVPGMAAVYRGWQRTTGARFYYVSGAPQSWNDRLVKWRDRAGFPRGENRLRDPRSRRSLREFKIAAVRELLSAHPRARFVLVGDSGQWDREAYGEVARSFPRRIAAICIRHVTCERTDSVRYQRAFCHVPSHVWRSFTEPGSIARLPL